MTPTKRKKEIHSSPISPFSAKVLFVLFCENHQLAEQLPLFDITYFVVMVIAVEESSSTSSSRTVALVLSSITHVSCQMINKLIPHISLGHSCLKLRGSAMMVDPCPQGMSVLKRHNPTIRKWWLGGWFALTCDLCSQGHFTGLVLLTAAHPRAAVAHIQLECPSWCSRHGGWAGRFHLPHSTWLVTPGDWHKLLAVTDTHLTGAENSVFFHAAMLF